LVVTMPPLRQRTDDVLLLAEHFLRRFSVEYTRPTKRLHPDTSGLLRAYDWPGNVRELENLTLRELLLTDDDLITIDPNRRPGFETIGGGSFDAEHTFKAAKAKAIADFERSFLGYLLMKTGGNISLAAKICGKDRSSLNKLVKKHGLSDEICPAPLD
jgi:DNA-binding NtrC family response regulator